MSKHEPLFLIDGKYLYREQNLIIVQVPVFFVCKDDKGQRYLILLCDFEEDTYVVCPVMDKDLQNMLMGNVPMRNLFECADRIYYVKSGVDLENDSVSIVSYKDVEEYLPDIGAIFETNDEVLKQYAEELCYICVQGINRVRTSYLVCHELKMTYKVDKNYAVSQDKFERKPIKSKFERSGLKWTGSTL